MRALLSWFGRTRSQQVERDYSWEMDYLNALFSDKFILSTWSSIIEVRDGPLLQGGPPYKISSIGNFDIFVYCTREKMSYPGVIFSPVKIILKHYFEKPKKWKIQDVMGINSKLNGLPCFIVDDQGMPIVLSTIIANNIDREKFVEEVAFHSILVFQGAMVAYEAFGEEGRSSQMIATLGSLLSPFAQMAHWEAAGLVRNMLLDAITSLGSDG